MPNENHATYLIFSPADSAERCVCCGAVIPEGSIICPLCADGVEHKL